MHLMLALDESRYAEAIIRCVRTLRHPAGTRLSLVHVLEPLDLPETLKPRHHQVLHRQQQAAGRALLERAARLLRRAYPDIKLILRKGLPIYEILRLLREGHPDVIVSGTRGLEGAKGLALGSVSQRLLSYAPCSVMLIPAKTKPSVRQKVLLATDGSRGAKGAAHLLTVLGCTKRVTVLTTVRPIDNRELAMQGLSLDELRAVRAQLRRGRLAAARQAIANTVQVLRAAGTTIETRILTGHPGEEIPHLAKQEGCDLLVLGSRGLTGKMAMAMGSVSLAVAQRALCPVLVVKPTA